MIVKNIGINYNFMLLTYCILTFHNDVKCHLGLETTNYFIELLQQYLSTNNHFNFLLSNKFFRFIIIFTDKIK